MPLFLPERLPGMTNLLVMFPMVSVSKKERYNTIISGGVRPWQYLRNKQLVMKNFILCFAVLLTSIFSFSQTLTGKVKDNGLQPVAGATVRLLNQSDSLPVQITSSEVNGSFSFRQLHSGRFILAIDMIGLQSYHQLVNIDSLQSNLQLPEIILHPGEAKELTAVIVRSKKPLLEHFPDKTIVNADAMIGSAASNVLEVLSRTPGVSIDNQGNISLNGKTGILLLINGRQTYMSAQDLNNYLKSLPGAALDKIELIDNPSARYDAAGNAIINLQLKRNRAGGFTGSVAAGYAQGKYGRQNYSVNLNYNYRKISLFTNMGYNVDKNYTTDWYSRRYYHEDGSLSSSVLLDNNQVGTGRSFNFMGGLDYELAAKTTLGFVANINRGNRNGRFDYFSEKSDSLQQPAGRGYGNTLSKDKRNNLGLNLNLLHKFSREGQELNVNVNYLRYLFSSQQELANFLDEQPVSRFSYQQPSSIRIYTANADYVQPLKNNGRLEAGIKSSFVKNDNTTDYYNKAGTIPVYDPALSNRFIYKENINAAYINGQRNWGRFFAQAGLRMEHTYINGKQPANAVSKDTGFSRNYVNWFPSVALSYKLDSAGKNILSLMANRRVNRPNYQLLNPFLFYKDNYSYSGGNPLLNPQFMTRYELKYQHGQLWWTGFSYSDFRSVILQTTRAEDSLFITRPGNYAKGIAFFLNVGVNVSPAKWWSMNTTVRLSRIGLRGTIYTEQLKPNTNLLRWDLNNYFTINPRLNAELSGYYASADMNGQTSTSGMYRVNAAIQHKVGEKGSIRLVMDDIFHSWVYHNRSMGLKQADFIQTSESGTQRFGLAFTYRFGKKSAKGRKSDAVEEEKGRAE